VPAPQQSPEQAFRLRKFQGTNTEVDSVFLGQSYVARSENWMPAQSYRLAKRPGTTLLGAVGFGTNAITHLLATHAPDGTPYLFAYANQAGNGFLAVSVNEQAFAYDPPNVAGLTPSLIGRSIAFRDRIYVGNGVDALRSFKIGDPVSANTQVYSAVADDGVPPPPSFTPYSGLSIATGAYSYAWSRRNTVDGLVRGRTKPGDFQAVPEKSIKFTAPSVTLGPNEVYSLFVAPRNLPIEYATLQTTGLAAGATTTEFTTFDVTGRRVPMAGGTNVFRTGNMLLIWRNRLVFSGMRDDPYAIFSTETILPGFEQAQFNQGTLFPAFARVNLPAKVTGIGVAGVTTDTDALAPLLFFTVSRTFIVDGDPFSPVGTAVLQEISSRVGCISHDTIVNTPSGTVFCGMDSVYLIPPGGGYPQDVGWPIADQVRQIPPALRAAVVATFHKQFYKLAIPVPGGAQNTHQWWLDLRQGVGQTPSWWGPMTGFGVSAMASDPSHVDESDRGYAAYAGTDLVVRTHQLHLYTDYTAGVASGTPIRSMLKSGRFDADQPFTVKVMTRLRLIAQAFIKSSLKVGVETDGGNTWPGIDDILLAEEIEDPARWIHLTPTSPPPPPPNSAWNTAKFVVVAPVEAQTITPYTRPRGLSFVITLSHNPQADPAKPSFGVGNIELRDFEMLFFFSERKVRYVGFTTNQVRKPPERVSK
jgi:hypothetical protein